MIVSRLPAGPTAFFKVSNVKLTEDIKGRGRKTSHQPELILNNFSTRLGHRVGRFLGSLFEHDPEFQGRQVVTFHNQRDFIFVRHHRYVFENAQKARLQEIGPRFTLKMRWLQQGTFDTKFGEYEWIHRQHKLDTSRRKFHL
jgi:ribosome production factor 1